jgi:membrane protein required for colicin V production
MILDVIFGFVLVWAIYNGFTKGVVSSLLSFVAIFLGILIAMNFSAIAARFMSDLLNVPPVVMPIFSFIVVLIVVILCIKLVAWVIEKMLQKVKLNGLNKAAGAVLWAALASIIFGVAIWLISQTGVFTESFKQESFTFKYVVPLGPAAIDYAGSILPFFTDAFTKLKEIIQNAAN